MTPLYILLAIVISAVGGYYFTSLVLKLAQRRSDKEQASEVKAAENSANEDGSAEAQAKAESTGKEHVGPNEQAAKNALRGGMWIGLLERVLITGFMLAGNTAGVALVIAVKGLGRYPELNAATSERFIIGTLASLLWAVLCAMIAGQLILESA